MMSNRHTTCFLFGSEEVLQNRVSSAVNRCGFAVERIHRIDVSTTRRFLNTTCGCLVFDTRTTNKGVVEATAELVRNRVWLPIVAIISSGKDEDSVESSRLAFSKPLRDGACEVVSFPDEIALLPTILESAARRDCEGRFAPAAMRRKMSSLTTREWQTIQLFLNGDNTKVVAKTLDITYQTVDKHRGRALKKLKARSVVDLQNSLNATMLGSMGMNLAAFNQPADNSKLTENEVQGTNNPMGGMSPNVGTAADLHLSALRPKLPMAS